MKITFNWIKDHLDTKFKEDKLLEQLTNVGLEVEAVENLSAGLDLFKVAKILKTEKHPNADRLKVCDVDVGEKEIKKSCMWCTKCQRRVDYSICSSWSHCS